MCRLSVSGGDLNSALLKKKKKRKLSFSLERSRSLHGERYFRMTCKVDIPLADIYNAVFIGFIVLK